MCQVLVLAGNALSIRQIYPLLTTGTANALVFGRDYCNNLLTSLPATPLAPLLSTCHMSAQEIPSICFATLHHSSAQQPEIILTHSVRAQVLMACKVLYVLLSPLLAVLILNLTPLPLSPFPTSHR